MLAATKNKVVTALNARLIADWRKAHRFWSNRLAVFWTAFSVLWLVWPSLQAVVSSNTYVVLTVGMSAAFVWARVTHQKGMVDG